MTWVAFQVFKSDDEDTTWVRWPIDYAASTLNSLTNYLKILLGIVNIQEFYNKKCEKKLKSDHSNLFWRYSV